MNAKDVIDGLQMYASAEDAVFLKRFFKTDVGQYGEGDVFIGVRVPMTRMVCKQFKTLPLDEVEKLLNSEIHEHRLAAVILLVGQYSNADVDGKKLIYDLFLVNVYKGRINNWDIVDSSAEYIIGASLRDKPRDLLFELAASDNIWQRRVAVLSTFHFIKNGDPTTTLELAEKLLHDKHDLIHKSVGWMLREIGKRIDEQLLTDFIERHYREMPRTMLRYAIEKLSAEQKRYFMS